ncbi:MAG: FUSC family protein [Oryzomonas sp.]|uniref:FUSC family protein n=1 Tax=Oryzomonas sp. TaxID=2855186 RepID=UPI00283F02F2|nr:FUSC family protein [Oryzomonas sp.]MDR3580940.1 FUSC family protein [Oryzomonas sp.]
MAMECVTKLILAKQNPPSFTHSARTAVAAIASLLVARLLRLPEAYWAPITTMIVMQSSLGAALPISAQRLAGTVLGAAMGALAVTWFSGNVLVFGTAVFMIGIICTMLRLDRNAYRFAGITLAIIMLVPRANSVWVMGVHRFAEVSVGIGVGLALTALWPEK